VRPPFRRRGEKIVAELGGPQRRALASLPALLAGVGRDRSDPAAARLTPPLHRDDPRADRRLRELIDPTLEEARGGDRGIFLETLEREPLRLSPEEAEAWVRVIGEGRLVLGARLGITEDGWSIDDLGGTQEAMLFGYLSWLQDHLVTELLATFEGDR
jgi:hypothetical protein